MSYSSIITNNNSNRGPTTGVQLSWDKKDLDIKTKSVEETLQPLINQVRITNQVFKTK